MGAIVLQGDVRTALRALPEKCVQCVVTSVPYYGLRDYGTATWEGGDPACEHVVGEIRTGMGLAKLGEKYRGGGHKQGKVGKLYAKTQCPHCGAVRVDEQIGQEATLDAYVAELVAVFGEVRRALRDDGALWLNIGDTVSGGGNGGGGSFAISNVRAAALGVDKNIGRDCPRDLGTGLKPKNIMFVPTRVAQALQTDGWYVRRMLPWLKRNPMPDSAKDRPTSTIEWVFYITKSAKVFFDYEGAKRKSSDGTHPRAARNGQENAVSTLPKTTEPGRGVKNNSSMNAALQVMPLMRAFRDSDLFFDALSERPFGLIFDEDGEPLALDVTTQSYREAHHATFPTKLVDPLIRASTSEHGRCSVCGSPYRRIVEKGEPNLAHQIASGADPSGNYTGQAQKAYDGTGAQNASDVKRRVLAGMIERRTIGWEPTCAHTDAKPIPCLVLDPFGGSGTVGVVANRLGRDAILVELKPEYVEMAERRIEDDEIKRGAK